MDLNGAVSEKESRRRGINTISPVVRAWVAVEEEVSSGSRSALSCRKSHVGRAQLHFHIPGYKGRLGTDIGNRFANPGCCFSKVRHSLLLFNRNFGKKLICTMSKGSKKIFSLECINKSNCS